MYEMKTKKITDKQEVREVVTWSDDLSYGIKAMDDDHKVMITLVNRMHAIVNEGADSSDVRPLLAKLAEYAILHFRREEIVMKTCHYPIMEEHIEYHHSLEKEVFELLKKKDQKLNKEETANLLQFLSNWLFEHISSVDQTLTPYVGKYREKIDAALKFTKAVGEL